MLKYAKLKKLNNEIAEKFIHKELVLGDGKEDSIIMMIGEAPGAKEVEYKNPLLVQQENILMNFCQYLT